MAGADAASLVVYTEGLVSPAGCSADRPEGPSEDCFVLGLEGKPIVIVPWKKSLPKPEVDAEGCQGLGSAFWHSQSREDGDAAAVGEAAGAPDMDIDGGSDERMEGHGAKRPAQAPAQGQHRQAPKARTAKPETVQGQGPHGAAEKVEKLGQSLRIKLQGLARGLEPRPGGYG
eukprot:s4414_g4.t1